jgi:hypothetical protein
MGSECASEPRKGVDVNLAGGATARGGDARLGVM